ncbi:MAG: ribose-5-phosphate isomerase RpiA [Alphaproteobacteria bacterium]|nr:ribose-5-phosphate isomerase RpiA [Alphaproteobacteria bacterium]
MHENDKRLAAKAALVEVRQGMKIGLGTGSTACHFVDLVGGLVREGLACVCVPTSVATERQARALGIPLAELDEVGRLDLTVDGADEVDPALNLIKGGGGALLREKIVAAATDRMVVIADGTKKVDHLGRFPLPIEINPFAAGTTTRAVQNVARQSGCRGSIVLRESADGHPFLTDGGHFILDASFGLISAPEALSRALLDIPGVVQHGLFLGMCKVAYLADNGTVTQLGA